MYQILIDRFATPHPQHCEKLSLGRSEPKGSDVADPFRFRNDYCGGNLPGIMEKVSYLEETTGR